MRLEDILKDVALRVKDPIAGLEVRNITIDSRLVREGDLFIAFRGYDKDGYEFIDEAVRKGAKIIISEKDFQSPGAFKKILVCDTRQALPVISCNFYGHPSDKLKVVGVTGTNGKTTITYIIENMIKCAGERAGVIGTISYRVGDKVIPAKNTTPGPLEVQSMLSEMAACGSRYAVMEISSHSLDQRRVSGILFDTAIFTNITSEHLDYHKTLDNYFKAKTAIFDNLKPGATAILNNDDQKVASLKSVLKYKALTYGIKEKADIRGGNIELSLDGSSFNVITPAATLQVKTKLMGIHNVSNILAAIAASTALGLDSRAAIKGIETMGAVPGRLEEISTGQQFKVFVDFAHTEDALFNILSVLKDISKNRIITVFGCGGNRDTKKRPLMGRAACQFSDHVIITSDNPRLEEPGDIIDEIVSGIKGKFSNYEIFPDRRQAIEQALKLARKGDIVVVAGKGHENYQIVKDKIIPFDDRDVVREALKKIGHESKRDSKDNSRKVTVG